MHTLSRPRAQAFQTRDLEGAWASSSISRTAATDTVLDRKKVHYNTPRTVRDHIYLKTRLRTKLLSDLRLMMIYAVYNGLQRLLWSLLYRWIGGYQSTRSIDFEQATRKVLLRYLCTYNCFSLLSVFMRLQYVLETSREKVQKMSAQIAHWIILDFIDFSRCIELHRAHIEVLHAHTR